MNVHLHTKDGQPNLILDQVTVTRQFNQLRILEVIAELANEAPLNHCLVVRLIIEDLHRLVGCHSLIGPLLTTLRGIVLLHGGWHRARNRGKLLKLLHDLNRLHQTSGGVTRRIDLLQR